MQSFKRYSILAGAVLGLGTLAFADTVVVSPGDMGSWSFNQQDGNTGLVCPANVCGTGSMVYGPATPPLGVGSANLQTALNQGQDLSSIVSTALNGVSLSSLTALSYSTYDTLNNGSQFPFMELMISDTAGDSNYGPDIADKIFFEPPYQTPGSGNPSLPNQGLPVMDQWQTWNALSGGWWDDNGICNQGAGAGGVCSLATLIAAIPGATIVPDLNGDGGVHLTVGDASSGENFNGYVDNVTFGVNGTDTTYDMEPVGPVPEPGTFVLFTGAGLIVFAYSRRKAKMQKQTL